MWKTFQNFTSKNFAGEEWEIFYATLHCMISIHWISICNTTETKIRVRINKWNCGMMAKLRNPQTHKPPPKPVDYDNSAQWWLCGRSKSGHGYLLDWVVENFARLATIFVSNWVTCTTSSIKTSICQRLLQNVAFHLMPEPHRMKASCELDDHSIGCKLTPATRSPSTKKCCDPVTLTFDLLT